MEQKYIVYSLSIILILIIGFFSTKVEISYPETIHNLSEEPLYKFITLFIIIFITQYNITIGLLITIIFLFTLADIGLISNVKESFNGPPVNSCKTYNTKNTKKLGTAFYPINAN